MNFWDKLMKTDQEIWAKPVGGYSKLQFVLLEALKDHSLKEIHEKFFKNGIGLGMLRKYVAGVTLPHHVMGNTMIEKLPKEYVDAWNKHVEYTNTPKYGW